MQAPTRRMLPAAQPAFLATLKLTPELLEVGTAAGSILRVGACIVGQ